ncbi:TPA: LysE family transporter [Candidatus Micrarchaeota archaeon]|nr:LysE family transporter [Candidatus Micrarchaeota archaeon]
MFEPILQGIFLGVAIAAPLGPTNVEVIRRGVKEGWKSSLLFYAGVNVALIIYLLLATFGLSFLLQIRLFNLILLAAGVLVLFYLAYSALTDFLKSKEVDLSSKSISKRNFFDGIALTITNPAVLLIWTSILGANSASKGASLTDNLMVSLGILAGAFLFVGTLILLTHYGRNFIASKHYKYVSLASGILLLYFALTFGYALVLALQ